MNIYEKSSTMDLLSNLKFLPLAFQPWAHLMMIWKKERLISLRETPKKQKKTQLKVKKIAIRINLNEFNLIEKNKSKNTLIYNKLKPQIHIYTLNKLTWKKKKK